jgi:hypothetical protein
MKFLKIVLFLMLPLWLFAWKMESGSVVLEETTLGSNTWNSIDFAQSYDEVPLVFALVNEGSGHKDDTPVIVRVRNISTTGFELVQVEAQSVKEDDAHTGPHPSVEVHYFVIDKGEHLLHGVRFLAQTHSTKTFQGNKASGSKGWDNVDFDTAFSDTPVILSQVQSTVNESHTLPGEASAPWLTTTIKDVDSDGFSLALERAETSEENIDEEENIAYLAIDANVTGRFYDTQTCKTLAYESMQTDDGVKGWNNGCYSYDFRNTYTQTPYVVGTQNSRDGNNGGWVRRCSLSSDAVGITIDEDQAHDKERSHITEIVSMFIFEKPFSYDSEKTLACKPLVSEYREDECYWLGSSNVDIRETQHSYDALAANDATTYQPESTDAYAGLCRAGDLNDTHYIDVNNRFTLGEEWTMSVWVKFPLSNEDQDYHILGSYEGDGDLPFFQYTTTTTGGGRYGRGSSSTTDIKWAIYDNDKEDDTADLEDDLDGWHQFTFLNNAEETKLYLDGEYVNSIGLHTSGEVAVLYTSTDDRDEQTLSGYTDELKFWDTLLNDDEISQLYTREKEGVQFDNTPRVCKTCEANATAGVWGLIGLPADLRSADNRDVADMFDEFPESSYADSGAEDGWIVFKREYSESNNSSKYSVVSYEDDPLEFGQGYWLLSKEDVSWSENGIINVDYNSTNENCPTSPCVEIPLTSVSLNFAEPDNDENDHTGKNRNNMLGFVGHTPVNWADCRIVVDDTSYTPSEAEDEGYVKKEIWQYNPDADDASSNGYVTCNDVTPGGCKLEPYKGFWLILQGKSKNKNMKLLLPKE